MSISKLAKIRVPADKSNYTPGRYVDYYTTSTPKQLSKISEITIHHMAGVNSAEGCGYGFQNPARNGSAHYGIGNDGQIANYVDEKDTAWANSNWESNCRAVTIETSNSKYGDAYGWPVSNAALSSLIKLVADIAIRNNLGKLVKGKNLTWHQMYAATQCPGSYILSKMDYIVVEANKIIVGGGQNPTPAPSPVSPSTAVCDGSLTNINGSRTANALVLINDGRAYTKFNQYGTDVVLDKNGVVINIIDNKANTQIPTGCRCLSGHGAAQKWIQANIKIGYVVWFENKKALIAKKQHRTVNGVNIVRAANYLCVYNTGTTAPTNPYGYEIAILNGVAVGNPVYGKGHMAIPKGGFVLSGHGDSGKWIFANIKNGTKVSFDGKKITLG